MLYILFLAFISVFCFYSLTALSYSIFITFIVLELIVLLCFFYSICYKLSSDVSSSLLTNQSSSSYNILPNFGVVPLKTLWVFGISGRSFYNLYLFWLDKAEVSPFDSGRAISLNSEDIKFLIYYSFSRSSSDICISLILALSSLTYLIGWGEEVLDWDIYS